MNLYPVYRTPGKAPPTWIMELGAAIVCLVGLPILIARHYARKGLALSLEQGKTP